MVSKKYLVWFFSSMTPVLAFGFEDISRALSPSGETLFASDTTVAGFGYGEVAGRELPGRVVVLEGEELRAYGYRDLGEALEALAGLYVMEVPGAAGPATTVAARGSDAASTLLVIDDVPFGNITYGWSDLALVPLETVDRVEVIYGPAAARWGEGALAGVICVYTMAGPRESAKSQLSAADGSFDTERYRFNFGMTARGYDLFFGGNRLFGHEPNTFERQSLYNLDWRVGRRWSGGGVDLVYGLYRRRVPVLRRYGWTSVAAPGEQKDHADRARVLAEFRLGPGAAGAEVYLRREFLSYDDVEPWREYAARARETGGDFRYTLEHPGGTATWRLGSVYRQDLHSGADGLVLSGRFLEEYSPGFGLRFHAGLGCDYYRSVGTAVTPEARASFFPRDWLTVYGAYSTGVRYPPLGFAARGAGSVERNEALEAGAKLFFGEALGLTAACWREDTDRAWLTEEELRVRVLRRRGVDLSAEGTLPPGVFYWGLSYGRVSAEYDRAGRPAYKPADVAYGRFGYRQGFLGADLTLRAEVTGSYVGARRSYGYRDRGPVKVKYDRKVYLEDLPGYFLGGMHFSVTIVSFEVFVDLENLGRSAAYRARPEYYMPAGARVYVGFLWTMYD